MLRKIFFSGEQGIFQNAFIKYILRKYDLSKFNRVLDVGCAGGHYLLAFKEKARFGIDYDKKVLNDTKFKANLTVGNITKKFPYKNNFFDLVIVSHVLEHLEKEEIFFVFGEFQRILNNNGLLVINSPLPDFDGWNYFSFWDHKTIINAPRLKFLIEKNKMKVENEFYFNPDIFPHYFRFMLLKLSPFFLFNLFRFFKKYLVLIARKTEKEVKK